MPAAIAVPAALYVDVRRWRVGVIVVNPYGLTSTRTVNELSKPRHQGSRLASVRERANSAGGPSHSGGRFLGVAAKLFAHRREQSVAILLLAARAETCEQRGAEHVRGNALVDRCGNRPAALARIRHTAGELCELWRLHQRRGGEVKQPRGDHAAPTPNLRDRRNVKLVGVVALCICDRCG